MATPLSPIPTPLLPARLATRRAPTLLLLATVACGGAGDGEPAPAPPPPDLSGARVMLLPVRVPAPESLDAELTFWLEQRSPTTDWVLPAELQAVADRTPHWRLRLETVHRAVADIGGGDLRVRDPLYTALRQLGAVVNSDYAVVPMAVLEVSESEGVVMVATVAVIDIRGGRVLWMHTMRGAHAPEPRGAVASVAEVVARTLIPR